MEYLRYIGYTARIYSQDLVLFHKQPAGIKKMDARNVYVSERYEKCSPRGRRLHNVWVAVKRYDNTFS
jgi:hypothetical protein